MTKGLRDGANKGLNFSRPARFRGPSYTLMHTLVASQARPECS